MGSTRVRYWGGESHLPHSAVNRFQVMRNRFRRGDFFDSSAVSLWGLLNICHPQMRIAGGVVRVGSRLRVL
jgi:hypothetical protein